MKRPEAKAPLLIEKKYGNLHIWTATIWAEAWIKKEAPMFGNLISIPPAGYILYVNPLYSIDEVKLWLENCPVEE